MSENYAQLITTFPIFQGHTAHGAMTVLERGEVKEHSSGEVLCREGDAAATVLLVLVGTVQVYIERGGEVMILKEAGPGSILGELAVLCGIPRAASLRSVDKVVALHWPKENFRRLMLGNAFLSERIMRDSLLNLIEKEKSLLVTLAKQHDSSSPSSGTTA